MLLVTNKDSDPLMCYEEQLKHARDEDADKVRATDTFGGICQVIRLGVKQLNLFTTDSGGPGVGLGPWHTTNEQCVSFWAGEKSPSSQSSAPCSSSIM